jgi:hypothetical protein
MLMKLPNRFFSIELQTKYSILSRIAAAGYILAEDAALQAQAWDGTFVV